MNTAVAMTAKPETAVTLTSADRRWLTELLGDQVRFDVPMRAHTTLGVGGPADALARPGDEKSLRALVTGARQRAIPWLVIGGGSNLLVRDGGIRGIVMVLGTNYKGIDVMASDAAAVTVSVKAGTRLSALCRYALEHGLAGLSFADGIPGTVGGAIAMNAGTAAGSIADVLTSVGILDAAGRWERIERKDLFFKYRRLTLPVFGRDSVAGEYPGRQPAVIVDSVFTLKRTDPRRLAEQVQAAKVARRVGQPRGAGSAGCFFKNPPDGLPAGRLIDLAGMKGTQVGGAQVSEQHGNFIINRGRASAADILSVAEKVKSQVAVQFGIQLKPEVIIVGELNHASKSV